MSDDPREHSVKGFHGDLVLRESGVGCWRVVDELTYVSSDETSYTVPADQATDLASTPRILWPWFPPFGSYSRAAVLHDYFYRTAEVSRKDADRLFHEAMLACGTSKWRAKVMYISVRWFGRSAYSTRQKETKEKVDG
jgi:hypothetical protein